MLVVVGRGAKGSRLTVERGATGSRLAVDGTGPAVSVMVDTGATGETTGSEVAGNSITDLVLLETVTTDLSGGCTIVGRPLYT